MSSAEAEPEHPHLRLIRAYFAAIEESAPLDNLAAFFTPDVQQREFPNRLVVQGAERGLEQLLAGRRRGREVVTDERYEILDAVVMGDRIAVELRWTARMRIPVGALKAGDAMEARCGVFFTIRDGHIARQHNYDCFTPF